MFSRVFARFARSDFCAVTFSAQSEGFIWRGFCIDYTRGVVVKGARGRGKTLAFRWLFLPCFGMLGVTLGILGVSGRFGFGSCSARLWERGQEPSQTPKFPAPFPGGGGYLFSVAVALSPSSLAGACHWWAQIFRVDEPLCFWLRLPPLFPWPAALEVNGPSGLGRLAVVLRRGIGLFFPGGA